MIDLPPLDRGLLNELVEELLFAIDDDRPRAAELIEGACLVLEGNVSDFLEALGPRLVERLLLMDWSWSTTSSGVDRDRPLGEQELRQLAWRHDPSGGLGFLLEVGSDGSTRWSRDVLTTTLPPRDAHQRAAVLAPAAARLRLKLDVVQRCLGLGLPDDPARWCPPPEARRVTTARSGRVLHGDKPAFGPGERVEIEVPVDLDSGLRPVLARRRAGRWAVIHPRAPEDLLSLAELGAAEDTLGLSLPLRPEQGEDEDESDLRFVIVLLPPELEIDWSLCAEERWQETELLLVAGELTALEVDLVLRWT